MTSARRRSARGFTLFEVAISLLIIAAAVLSVVLMLPSGIRVQQRMRHALYASAKALEVMDAFTQQSNRLTGQVRMEVPLGDGRTSAAEVMRSQAGVFGRSMSPDIEQVLVTGSLGLLPLPLTIARRLSSDNDEIQRLLDQGGALYYCDPGHGRGQAGEQQHLLMGVTGYPQQNALPNHPMGSWPIYELYPFPPQGDRAAETAVYNYTKPPKRIVRDKDGNIIRVEESRDYNGDPRACYYDIVLPPIAIRLGDTNYQQVTWKYMAARMPSSAWGNGWSAWVDLNTWGWNPILFKIKGTGGVLGELQGPGYEELNPLDNRRWNSGNPGTQNPPKPPGFGRGNAIDNPAGHSEQRLLTYFKPLLDSVNPSDPYYEANRLRLKPVGAVMPQAMGRPTVSAPVTPTSTTDQDPPYGARSPYGSDRDMQTEWEYALPSLAARRYYLRLALRLWQKVGGTIDPTVAVVPTPIDRGAVWQMDDAARLLALSYVAHAAMMCTGYRRPLIDDRGAPQTDRPLDAKGNPLLDIDLSESNPAGVPVYPKYKGPYAIDDDHSRGKMAHENCLRWAMCYANEAPMDMLAPRPANRMTLMDKPLYAFDLFDKNGKARRRVDNFNGHWPPKTESLYGVVGARPGFLITPWTEYVKDDFVTFEWTRDLFASPDNARCRLTTPFLPSERCRMLVFWSADWQSYEDFESAPSAPMDESNYRVRNGPGDWSVQNPEGRLLWSHADRKSIGDGRTSRTVSSLDDIPPGWPRTGPYTLYGWTVMGQWGADRNGNGKFDKGPVPASTRMRAEVVARYPVYDPVVRTALRN